MHKSYTFPEYNENEGAYVETEYVLIQANHLKSLLDGDKAYLCLIDQGVTKWEGYSLLKTNSYWGKTLEAWHNHNANTVNQLQKYNKNGEKIK